MDSLLKRVVEANLSVYLIEFGCNAVSTFILDEELEEGTTITCSKFINSDFVTLGLYGKYLNDIVSSKLVHDTECEKSLHDIFIEEYNANMGEINDTFMIVSVGKKENKLFLPFTIYHKYIDRTRCYHFVITDKTLSRLGRDEIIGRVGAAIALYKDQEVPEMWFQFDGKNLLRSVKSYDSEKTAIGVRE